MGKETRFILFMNRQAVAIWPLPCTFDKSLQLTNHTVDQLASIIHGQLLSEPSDVAHVTVMGG